MGQLGDLSPGGSVAVGIVVGLLSTSIQSLGLTLQRKSHLLEDEKDVDDARRPPYKRRRWQLGMGMFIVSNLVGSTIQITTLPLPVLSTLQASGLVFNTAFATILLKEPFTSYSLVGTILTCVGAGLIAGFGAIAEPAHDLSQLLDFLYQRPFVIWMTSTLLVAVVTILFAHILKLRSSHSYLEKYVQPGEPRRSRSGSMSMSESIGNLKRTFTAGLPQAMQVRVGRLRLIRGLSYALISGILSAHSLLVAKSAVELLVRTIVGHNNQFNHFQSWLILLALLFFALTQLYYLHLGLRLCSTSVLYPFVFCIYNIVAILDGLIYFRQGSRLSHLHAGLIAVGTVILLSGVLALSWRLDDATPADLSVPALPVSSSTDLPPGSILDGSTSPILPFTRPRSATSASRKSIDEQTPLLTHHRRRRHPTITFVDTVDTDAASIWAELDDDRDVLGSLPRPSSQFSLHGSSGKRQRSNSSSQGPPSPDLPSSQPRPSNRHDSKKRLSLNAQKRPKVENRRSSAPGVVAKSAMRKPSPMPLEPGTDGKEVKGRARTNSASVKFAESEVEQGQEQSDPSIFQENRPDTTNGNDATNRRDTENRPGTTNRSQSDPPNGVREDKGDGMKKNPNEDKGDDQDPGG